MNHKSFILLGTLLLSFVLQIYPGTIILINAINDGPNDNIKDPLTRFKPEIITQSTDSYTDTFDDVWLSRYTTQNIAGGNSSWSANNANSLYTFTKSENTTALPINQTMNIISDYNVLLNCNKTNIEITNNNCTLNYIEADNITDANLFGYLNQTTTVETLGNLSYYIGDDGNTGWASMDDYGTSSSYEKNALEYFSNSHWSNKWEGSTNPPPADENFVAGTYYNISNTVPNATAVDFWFSYNFKLNRSIPEIDPQYNDDYESFSIHFYDDDFKEYLGSETILDYTSGECDTYPSLTYPGDPVPSFLCLSIKSAGTGTPSLSIVQYAENNTYNVIYLENSNLSYQANPVYGFSTSNTKSFWIRLTKTNNKWNMVVYFNSLGCNSNSVKACTWSYVTSIESDSNVLSNGIKYVSIALGRETELCSESYTCTTNPPQVGYVGISSFETSTVPVGYRRWFPGFNVTDLLPAQNYGAEIRITSLTLTGTFNESSSYPLLSTDQIQFFTYNYSVNNIANTSLFTDTQANLRQFWNVTSQVNTSKVINRSSFLNSFSVDLTSLAIQWNKSRNSETEFGIGIQLYNFNNSVNNISRYGILTGLTFVIKWQVILQEDSYASITSQLQERPEFTTTMDFFWIKKANQPFASHHNYSNQFSFQLAIGTILSGIISISSFFRLTLYDAQSTVYAEWDLINGTILSYNLGVTLQENKKYKFTIDFRRESTTLKFSITDAQNNLILSPKSWNNLTSNEYAEIPALLTSETIDSPDNDLIRYNHGYLVTANVSSSYIMTGTSRYGLDRFFATSQLLDLDFRCSYGLSTVQTTKACNNNNNGLIESESYGVSFDGGPAIEHTALFNYTVKDFRSFAGLMGMRASNLDGIQEYEYIRIKLEPYYKNGTLADSMFVDIRVNTDAAGSVYAYLTDNSTLRVDFAKNAPYADAGFGFYWVRGRPGVLAGTLKFYNSTGSLEVHPVYGNYDASEITDDVLITLWYTFNSKDSNSDGSLTITDPVIQKGRLMDYVIPSIPDPSQPYKPPGMFDWIGNPLDDLWGGITGFFGGLYDGFVGALGWIFDNILQPILAGLFDLIIPFLISVVSGILQVVSAILDAIIDLLPADIAALIRSFAHIDLNELATKLINLWDLITKSLITLIWLALTFYIFTLPAFESNGEVGGYLSGFFKNSFTFHGATIMGIPLYFPPIIIWLISTVILGYWSWVLPFTII